MDDDEEVDIIGNYDDISKISSGQILECDYTVHPKWVIENAEGGNFWSDSVPKHENLESNVEVLHTEEVVIEKPEPVPNLIKIQWYGDHEVTSQAHDDIIFDDDIPATVEEVVPLAEESQDEFETLSGAAYDCLEPAAFETHPPSKNVKYIGPRSARSLLKVQLETTTPNDDIETKIRTSKFKQTLTVCPNYLKSDKIPKAASQPKTKAKPKQSSASKFRKTVVLQNKFRVAPSKSKSGKESGGKKSTGGKSTKRTRNVSDHFGENITIIHDSPSTFEQPMEKINVMSHDSESDVEIDVESEMPYVKIEPQERVFPSTSAGVRKTENIVFKKEEKFNSLATNERGPELGRKVVPKIEDYAIPTQELSIDPNQISDLEIYIHCEFFEGRSTKTPEQYLRIRNHILDMWQSTKPAYVSKTSVRHGLKHGGDVNCISRVHRLLEQIGAINFGYEGKYFEYVRPLPEYMAMFLQMPRNRVTSRSSVDLFPANLERRQRRKSTWNENEKSKGYTIVHDSKSTTAPLTSKSLGLIKCLKFRNDQNPPFKISITLSTLLCIQLHSISSSNEVMGFLGGHRNHYLGEMKIRLTRYKPCRTRKQTTKMCEMCPISQLQQASSLTEHGFELLGWFHSHPTFPPNPSRTDIRTQYEMQHQFSLDDNPPFIGVIFSCSDMKLKCMYILPDYLHSQTPDSVIPFEIDVNVIKDCTTMKQDIRDVLDVLDNANEDVVNEFRLASINLLNKLGFGNEVYLHDLIDKCVRR